MSDIKVNIVGEFKKKGFDDADKATSKLEKSFKRLGMQVAAAFSVAAVTRFTKASVKAFLDEDKAVRRLGFSLKALGQAYMLPEVEEYISNLQRATAVSDGELRPALQQLLTVTGDLGKSQELLNTALDVSAGTGKDLRTITQALGRAYAGNTTSLGRLNIGIKKADLASKSFDENLRSINDRFKGSATAAAGTYAAQMQAIANTAGDAQEIIGQGLVDAIALLGGQNGVKTIQDQMLKLAEDTADVARGLGVVLEKLNFKVQADAKSNSLASFLGLIPVAGAYLAPLVTKLGQVGDAVQKINAPLFFPSSVQDIKTQREQARLRRLEEQRRKRAEALEKKLAAEKLKREKEAQQLKRAGTVFDMENIQIVAALQNKVTDDQRLRLTALLAINNGNAEAAEKLSTLVLASNAPALANLGVLVKSGDTIDTVVKKLIESQTRVTLLGMGIADIPKAKNPFEDWPSIIASLIAQVNNLKSSISSIGGGGGGGSTGGTTSGGKGGNSGVGGETFTVPSAITPPAGVGGNFGGGFTLGANQYPNSSYFAGLAATAPYVPSSYFATAPNYATTPPTVVVNIAGNVTAEQDLINAITEGLYTVQKRGQNVIYNAVAL